MRRDLPDVLRSDAVALLPEWRSSVGALREVLVARAAGIPVYLADDILDSDCAARPLPLDEADLARALAAAIEAARRDWRAGGAA